MRPSEDIDLTIRAKDHRGLPLDVAATITNAIAAVYPRAAAIPDFDGFGLRIPGRDRDRGRPNDEELDSAERVSAGDVDVRVRMHEEGWAFSVYEQFALGLTTALRTYSKEIGATNYLESTTHDPETGESWIVTVQVPNGKTPHALRQDAENRLARLRVKLDDMLQRSEAEHTCGAEEGRDGGDPDCGACWQQSIALVLEQDEA